MSRGRGRVLDRALWASAALLGVAALGIAALLFVPRKPLSLPSARLEASKKEAQAPSPDVEILAGTRMSRAVIRSKASAPARAQAAPLESLVRLTAVFDFEGKSPALAVVEILQTSESKTVKAGDRIGETGALVREILESVLVEYAGKVYKLTFAGVQEVPNRALGMPAPGREGDR